MAEENAESQSGETRQTHKAIWLAAGGTLGGACVFVLQAISGPILELVGEGLRDSFDPKGQVFLTACTSFESAHNVFRVFDKGSEENLLLKKEPADPVNRLGIQVFNLTRDELTNVRITIVAFFGTEDTDDFAYVSAATNGLDASQRFEVGHNGRGAMRVSIDRLSPEEGVILDGAVLDVVDFHVELKSEEKTVRTYFPAGCPNDRPVIEVSPLYRFYEKKTDACGQPIDDGRGGFSCAETLEFPKEVTAFVAEGAVVEVTQERDGKVIRVMSHEFGEPTPGPVRVPIDDPDRKPWEIF